MDKAEFYKDARLDSRGPLEGLKVLEATNWGSAPICGALLVDLGAESIKIDMPKTGDPVRHVGPFIGDNSKLDASLFHNIFNRGKRNITLDIRHPEGKAIFKELAKDVDIIIENFTPGTMDKWGLGYQDMRGVKPDIIYVSISGFGQFGPLHKNKSFDPIAQAMAGMMVSTGEKGGRPLRTGHAIADNAVGWQGVIGALSALFHRQRTGEGQHVDANLADAMLYTSDMGIMGTANANYKIKRLGNAIETGAPFNTYVCKDGRYIYIHGVLDAHWQALCRIMGREDLITDERTATMQVRPQNIEFVDEVVGNWTATVTIDEASAALEKGGIAAGPVLDFPEIIKLPHYRERDSVVEIEHPHHGTLTTYGVGTKYSRTPASIKGPAPGLGQHNQEVYKDLLGYSDDKLAELSKSGVI